MVDNSADLDHVTTQRDAPLHPAVEDLHLVLGSASPRRKELLSRLGANVEIIAPEIDETQLPHEQPRKYVERLAREKAATVAQQYRDMLLDGSDKDGASLRSTTPPGESTPPADIPKIQRVVVIAADTIVVAQSNPILGTTESSGELDEIVLGKPSNQQDAVSMLKLLSGTTHQVLTAVAVARLDGTIHSDLGISTVTFRPLSEAEITWYVSTGEGADKAGGYAIQGHAAVFVESIIGDPTNVIGLPLPLTTQLLIAAVPDRRR